MTILIIEPAYPPLCGKLCNWFVEFKAGLLIGNVNSRVREKIWKIITEENRINSAVMIYSYPNTQGFEILTIGERYREVIEVDGVQLVKKKT